MTDHVLELRGVSKAYKDFALKGVSFDVPRGFVCGLIGPNGAGKTTIVKLIMNLIRRDAGDIRVFGLDNRARETAVKARIGFVYDGPCFYEDVSLRNTARAVAPFYPGWDDDRFRRLVTEFELPLDKAFKKLSLGMRTKFALAIALAHDADLILMDEPTAGLDPAFRRDLLQRLSVILQDERKSVLFSTHLTADLERIADFIVFVRDGEIVFSLPKDELLDSWAIVRGDVSVIDAIRPPARRGIRRGPYGVDVLTSDGAAARQHLGPGASVDRPTLEEIMVIMCQEAAHAA